MTCFYLGVFLLQYDKGISTLASCVRWKPVTVLKFFFFWPDKDNLFVPSAIHFEIVYLRPDSPAVVPCRVTDPQAIVTLHREVPPEEITANDTLVTYDPTKGFVLQSPSSEHQGVFYCKAVTKGTPQISVKYQLLYVEGKEAAVTQHFSMLINTGTYCNAAPSVSFCL